MNVIHVSVPSFFPYSDLFIKVPSCLMIILNAVSFLLLSLFPLCFLSHPFVGMFWGPLCFVCSGRLQSPFLSKQVYEPERANSAPRQASPSPVPAAAASVVRATGLCLTHNYHPKHPPTDTGRLSTIITVTRFRSSF